MLLLLTPMVDHLKIITMTTIAGLLPVMLMVLLLLMIAMVLLLMTTTLILLEMLMVLPQLMTLMVLLLLMMDTVPLPKKDTVLLVTSHKTHTMLPTVAVLDVLAGDSPVGAEVVRHRGPAATKDPPLGVPLLPLAVAARKRTARADLAVLSPSPSHTEAQPETD